MDISYCLFSLLSSVRLFLIQINTEGRFESSLGSTTERRMNGYPVIVNRLIDNVFWLICKDERKEGMIGLVRGWFHLPLCEKDAELFEKGRCVSVKPRHLFNKLTELFWKPQGLFAALSLIIGLYIRWHQPTRIYASGYTYIRISPHIYMSSCQALSYPVPGFDLFVFPPWQTLFHVVYL